MNTVADQTNQEGDAVNLQLTATDARGDTLEYSASGLPSGLSIDQNGLISGTISAGAGIDSSYTVTVSATDNGQSASQTFEWSVNPVVSLSPATDQNNVAGTSVSLPLSATDALGNALTYSASGLPPGLSIDSTTGTITGAIPIGADAPSPYAVTVTASDGTYSATQSFNWNVAALGLVNPGSQNNVLGDQINLQIIAERWHRR
jgi:hypothetical protein